MRILPFLASLIVVAPAFAESAPNLLLVPVSEGGFIIERATPADDVDPVGLADAKELAPLLAATATTAEKVDFTNGVKLEGPFTITVGREDGTVARFEDARDVIAFAAKDSIATAGQVTTLNGGVVFSLKVDNKRSLQRFERGVITLTAPKKAT